MIMPLAISRKRRVARSSIALLAAAACLAQTPSRSIPAPGAYAHAKMKPLPLYSVRMTDGFWKPRIETSIAKGWFDLGTKFDKEGHLEPFRIIADKRGVPSNKRPNNDEFVFKWMEAGGYYSGYADCGPDCQKIHDQLSGMIDLVLSIQKPDGYLNSYFGNPSIAPTNFGVTPFNPEALYEFYNFGHLAQAAIALYRATGERRLLDGILRYADLIVTKFSAPNHLPYRMNRGPINLRYEHPNHELAMVELYRVTGDKRYLAFAKQTLDEYNYWSRFQIDGHGVRETLLSAAAADLYLEDGDTGRFATPTRLWDDMVKGRMYLTGGVGSRREGESFGDKYELPNDAYAETCAAIGSFFWSYRMLLATGQARYADLMERLLYNGIIAGVSLSGTEYCYRNPLSADPHAQADERGAPRKPFFGVPCCPPNVARLLASLADYFYSTTPDGFAVNLYGANEARVPVGGQTVRLAQQTSYPWDGKVRITVTPERPADFAISLRAPSWTAGRPVASDLYRYVNSAAEPITVTVNGQLVDAKATENGYIALRRNWKAGDTVDLNLPMTVRRVVAHDSVLELRGHVALERGPVVYCVEGVDHNGHALDLALPDSAEVKPEFRRDLLGGVTVLRASGSTPITAIPYAVWDNRGFSEMTVWLRRP
jgi:DUF1680 family protein